MQCVREDGKPSPEIYQAELQDDGLYRMECSHGHRTVTCLQEQKFEVLYDIGANAIVDCYYREAVSSFASCLERFYEFYVSIIADKHQVNEEIFQQCWKRIVNQSERQLGAFIFTYMIEEGKSPPLLSEKSVAFRNSVMHKGKIPTRDQAIAFGKEVLGLVSPLLRHLKVNYSEQVGRAVVRHVMKTRQATSGDPNIQFFTTATTISIARGNTEADPTLEDTLTRLQQQRARGRYYL
jgi:hypothetical protein